jgi:DNA-binding transcriptional LysR family regulator
VETVEQVRHIDEADLGPEAREAIEAVQRGQTAVIESDGQPEAAIVDIVDYRLLRAAMRYYARQPQIDVEAGLSNEAVAELEDPQARYDLVLAHYLGGSLSLSRVGELLGLAWIDLRDRFNRLDIPIFTGPATLDELRAEIAAADAWISP